MFVKLIDFWLATIQKPHAKKRKKKPYSGFYLLQARNPNNARDTKLATKQTSLYNPKTQRDKNSLQESHLNHYVVLFR